MKNKQIINTLKKGFPKSEHLKEETIIIIGAGIAGLTAGQILHHSGAKVIILEAQNLLGGRIKALENFTDSPIELGAEFVHGENSAWFQLLKKNKIKLENIEDKFWEFYSINGEFWSEEDLLKTEEFKDLIRIKDNLYSYRGKEMSIKAYLEQTEELADEGIAVLENWLSAEYGDSLKNISLPAFARSGRAWQAGQKNYTLPKNTFFEVLHITFENILSLIQYEKIVNEIDYSDTIIKVKTIDNQVFEANKVILTVPISILQKNKIMFKPDLPLRRKEAINHLKIAPVIKVILRFSQNFWGNELSGFYSAYPHIINFYPSAKTEKEHILTAFLAGEEGYYFQELEKNKKNEGINFLLELLCDTFHNRIPNFSFEKSYLIDWSEIPYIEGGYSVPASNSYFWRKKLALPLKNQLFWAGEATSARHSASVNGALETGFRAAKQVWIGEE